MPAPLHTSISSVPAGAVIFLPSTVMVTSAISFLSLVTRETLRQALDSVKNSEFSWK